MSKASPSTGGVTPLGHGLPFLLSGKSLVFVLPGEGALFKSSGGRASIFPSLKEKLDKLVPVTTVEKPFSS
ncbi:MAG: hypothetical protein ABRQ27_09780 [Clostridiaceae bacterium]